MSYAFFRNIARAFRASTTAVLTVCAIVAIPASVAAAAPAATTVDITQFAFSPREITVAPGTRIVWTNHDGAPHTVTSNDKSFASKGLDTDDKYEHTFATEGNFIYYCTVHPMMTGVVHVRKQ
jgi:plastocyanin